MSYDRFFDALVYLEDQKGNTLEQTLGRVPFGTQLLIRQMDGTVIFDGVWPWHAFPPHVVGWKFMPMPVVKAYTTGTALVIEVL